MSDSFCLDKEEKLNVLTHGLGALCGVFALFAMLLKAQGSDWLSIASLSVYGGSMIVLYLASTCYHAISAPVLKKKFKIIDHCAIYLLIAGTYSPFLLISLKTPLALVILIVVWLIAITGIVLKIAYIDRFKRLSLVLYLVMGWLSLVLFYQLSTALAWQGVVFLALGGLAYSVGLFFYVKTQIPYHHAIWHVFVLAGSGLHFYAIYRYVL